jgi:hypothetical protein
VARAAAVAADLQEMRKLREYLIFHAKAKVPTRDPIDAIDDHAEKLTGDRRALHAPNHSIGQKGTDPNPRHYLLNLYRRPSTYS